MINNNLQIKEMKKIAIKNISLSTIPLFNQIKINVFKKKLYNKLDKMNKSTLLTIIQERNIGYTFTEDDSKSDIVQSLLEYFKLKYECWIIYKYFLKLLSHLL